MTSPFEGRRDAFGAGSPWHGMVPGETRTVIVGKEHPTELTLTRTNRDFIHDFADAQNRHLNPRGFQVAVVAGSLQFGKYRRREPDRPLSQASVDRMANGDFARILIPIGLDKGWIVQDNSGRYCPAPERRAA